MYHWMDHISLITTDTEICSGYKIIAVEDGVRQSIKKPDPASSPLDDINFPISFYYVRALKNNKAARARKRMSASQADRIAGSIPERPKDILKAWTIQ